jgi:hypothetical protein
VFGQQNNPYSIPVPNYSLVTAIGLTLIVFDNAVIMIFALFVFLKDVIMFRPFKAALREEIASIFWNPETHERTHPDNRLNRSELAMCCCKSWRKACKPTNIIEAFSKPGVFLS